MLLSGRRPPPVAAGAGSDSISDLSVCISLEVLTSKGPLLWVACSQGSPCSCRPCGARLSRRRELEIIADSAAVPPARLSPRVSGEIYPGQGNAFGPGWRTARKRGQLAEVRDGVAAHAPGFPSSKPLRKE